MIESKEFPNSTNIAYASYDTVLAILDIQFRGGRSYRYTDVPYTLFLDLCNAPSAGKFVNSQIKGKYRVL